MTVWFYVILRTRIATPSSSWLDDYFDWLMVSSCCKTYTNGSFCPSSGNLTFPQVQLNFASQHLYFVSLLFCFFAVSFGCVECNKTFVNIDNGIERPSKETFDKYFPQFLNDLPSSNCAKAGRAAYSRVSQPNVMAFPNSSILIPCYRSLGN